MSRPKKQTVKEYRNRGTEDAPYYVYEMSCGHDLPVFKKPSPDIIGQRRACSLCGFEYRQNIWENLER